MKNISSIIFLLCSFMYPNLLSAEEDCHDFGAGPIHNQAEAWEKCSAECINQSRTWNGQWTSTGQQTSVCGCCKRNK
jgi:hypothetical protein